MMDRAGGEHTFSCRGQLPGACRVVETKYRQTCGGGQGRQQGLKPAMGSLEATRPWLSVCSPVAAQPPLRALQEVVDGGWCGVCVSA